MSKPDILMHSAHEDGNILDAVLDHAPCGFLSFADDGAIELVNATLLDLLGYQRSDLMGKRIETILGVGSRIFYQTHLFPLVRMHGRAEEIFLLLRTKGGSDLGVLTNVVRQTRGGKIVNDCVFLRVVERQKFEHELLHAKKTAEKALANLELQTAELQQANDLLEAQALEMELQQQQLQEQTLALEAAREELQVINDELLERAVELERQRTIADEANRAKSTFLAVMSHELRTPLNAIAGYVQLLEMGIHGPVTDEQKVALDRVGQNQRHLLRLINDVLNLSRIEAGRVEYTLTDVPLSEMIAEVLPLVEPQLQEKGLTSSVDIPPLLAVRADREKLLQILINLFSNAIKFTPQGGSVALKAAVSPESQDEVHLSVADNGIGIPRDKLGSVFEPFVQVDVSRTRRSEGTGLGLAISRDLAHGMGGDLRAHSVLGEGSTFTLILPRGAAADQ